MPKGLVIRGAARAKARGSSSGIDGQPEYSSVSGPTVGATGGLPASVLLDKSTGRKLPVAPNTYSITAQEQWHTPPVSTGRKLSVAPVAGNCSNITQSRLGLLIEGG